MHRISGEMAQKGRETKKIQIIRKISCIKKRIRFTEKPKAQEIVE